MEAWTNVSKEEVLVEQFKDAWDEKQIDTGDTICFHWVEKGGIV